MKDSTEQAILTLSRSMQEIARQVVGTADYPKFYSGHILRMTDNGVYDVAMGDQVVSLPVYGKGVLTPGQSVFIVSPHNSQEIHDMWILAPGANSGQSGSQDQEVINQLIRDVANKVDKGGVVQSTGQSETNIMSQKAVTNALEALKQSTGQSVQGVRIGLTKLVVDSDNVVTIPVAKDATLGVVRSKTGTNHVVVDAEGDMTVDSLDVLKLEQKTDDTIILDSGDSAP